MQLEAEDGQKGLAGVAEVTVPQPNFTILQLDTTQRFYPTSSFLLILTPMSTPGHTGPPELRGPCKEDDYKEEGKEINQPLVRKLNFGRTSAAFRCFLQAGNNEDFMW